MSRFLRTALAVLVLVVATSACLLGRWQLHRLAARRALNATLLAKRDLPIVNLAIRLPPLDSLDNRRVQVRGRFDPSRQLFLRGRVINETPGLEVVTPFRTAGGESLIWILRGFVASPDAATPPAVVPPPDSGEVAITGLAEVIRAARDSGAPLRRPQGTTWARLDAATLRSLAPGSLPVAVLPTGDSSGPGHLIPIPPPALSEGPHLSYAIQWFGIAMAALAFGVIFLWRDRHPGKTRGPVAP